MEAEKSETRFERDKTRMLSGAGQETIPKALVSWCFPSTCFQTLLGFFFYHVLFSLPFVNAMSSLDCPNIPDALPDFLPLLVVEKKCIASYFLLQLRWTQATEELPW